MSEHDLVARWIAAHRFPFPDQRDWPATYVTLTNVDGPIRGVAHDGRLLYPDIVIVDGESQRIAEIGEVVDAIPADAAVIWRAFSAACKPSSTGARSFFIYAPASIVEDARRILDSHAVSYAGLRTYTVVEGAICITPIVTPGDVKDHR